MNKLNTLNGLNRLNDLEQLNIEHHKKRGLQQGLLCENVKKRLPDGALLFAYHLVLQNKEDQT